MKKLFFILAIGCLLISCHSDIDLGNLDTKAELELGVAMPLGSINMTLKDLLGDVDGLYVDSTKQRKGVLVWKTNDMVPRDYHEMNLAQYLSAVDVPFNVYDQLSSMSIHIEEYGIDIPLTSPAITSVPMPFDITIPLEFPFDLPLDGINADKTYRERLDKAEIDNAKFRTLMSVSDLPLKWEWVDSIVLDLGDRFNRPAGPRMPIYVRPSDGSSYGFGDTIPIYLDNFALDMMKEHPDPNDPANALIFINNNVYDTCSFRVKFQFTIPKGTVLTSAITPSSAINYHLDVQFLNFTAIWGMFEPSEFMSDENVIDLNADLGRLNFLNDAVISLGEPEIAVDIETEIAGAFYIDSAYAFVTNDVTDSVFAWFGNTEDERNRYHQFLFEKGQWLPLDSKIGAITTNLKVKLDHTPRGGRIHELFSRVPRKLGYRFAIKFNSGITPQIRITPNTFITIRTLAKLPFIFNEGIWMNYPDTVRDLDLSEYSLNSLKDSIDILDTVMRSDLSLVLRARNTIPMQVKAVMRCYDEDDQLIMNPLDNSKPFTLFDTDTIVLLPPDAYDAANNNWDPNKYGETTMVCSLNKEALNLLPDVKTIIYSAILDDKALKKAYEDGMSNIQLKGNQGINMKVGITANVNAVLNLWKNDK